MALRHDDGPAGRPGGRPRAAAACHRDAAGPDGETVPGTAGGAGDLRRRRAAGIGPAGVRPAGRRAEGEDRGHPDGQRATPTGRPPRLAEFLEPWNKRGVASAVLLHTRSRARADEPGFTRPLEEATGVWFSGGRPVPRDRGLSRHGRRAGAARGARARRGHRRHVGRRRDHVAGDDHRRPGRRRPSAPGSASCPAPSSTSTR